MMHGREKSDPSIVAMKPANEGGRPLEELVEPMGLSREADQGRGERGTARHAPDTETGKHVPRAGSRTASSKGTEAGTVHRTAAPRRCCPTAVGLWLAAQGCISGRGWRDLGRVWRWTGRPAGRPARTCSPRSLSGATVTAGLHPEAGRAAAATGHRGAGRQDCPARPGRGAECHMGGRLPWFQLRVPPQARSARRAGRTGGRDQPAQGELDTGRRHSGILRYGQSRMAAPVRRTPGWRPARTAPDPQVAEGRSDGRRGDQAGRGRHAPRLRGDRLQAL